MPIIDLQRRLQEAGRIRIGKQVETARGGKRPASLSTFRLTSPDRARIEAAAELYGGEVKEWENLGRKEWEVETTVDRLPVIVPPSAMTFSQWYEQWSGGGCLRRCDGQTEQIKDQPCVCDAANPDCTPHTRLSILLSEVPGLGLWRLDTSGWHAARELASAVEIISVAAGIGMMLPATLRLEQRSSKAAGDTTKRYVVPVLDITATPAQLVTGELEQRSVRAALTPVPQTGTPTIAEQVESAKAIESRKRTESMPATGVKPRTAAQAKSTARIPNEDPYKDVPPPDAPVGTQGTQGTQVTQVMKAVSTAVETATDDAPIEAEVVSPLANKEKLKTLARLLSEQGMDNSPEGKQAKLDWCISAVGRELNTAADLTEKEIDDVIAILTPPEIDDKLQKINERYASVSKEEMIADITQFLQLETKLENLTDLSPEETDAIIEALSKRTPEEGS